MAGRPLGSTPNLFRVGKRVTIPSWHSQTIAAVAARTRAGALESSKARRVGDLYLVPTTSGGVCIQGPRFLTCHHGLLRSGVTWGFQSTATGIAVYGLAADGVARVSLGSQTATVHDNVFFLTRRMKLVSAAHLPRSFGTLTVSYRNRRMPARVQIR